MGTIRGPKRRLCRALGGVALFGESHSPERHPTPPGQHGDAKGRPRRGNGNDYGAKLKEKQKLRLTYAMMEKQFRRTVETAMHMAGNTSQNLVALLESRLDNLAYKLGYARTIFQARQLVGHGHVTVNGKKVDVPSYQCRPNDVIGLREKASQNLFVLDSLKRRENMPLPTYLLYDASKKAGTFLRKPTVDEVPSVANLQAIIEFYSR